MPACICPGRAYSFAWNVRSASGTDLAKVIPEMFEIDSLAPGLGEVHHDTAGVVRKRESILAGRRTGRRVVCTHLAPTSEVRVCGEHVSGHPARDREFSDPLLARLLAAGVI